jgi:hypothetical protein
MVLRGELRGRVGRRRNPFKKPLVLFKGLFFGWKSALSGLDIASHMNRMAHGNLFFTVSIKLDPAPYRPLSPKH